MFALFFVHSKFGNILLCLEEAEGLPYTEPLADREVELGKPLHSAVARMGKKKDTIRKKGGAIFKRILIFSKIELYKII